jgi:RNA polymerase sigma-70 factor (ECF subfamily)
MTNARPPHSPGSKAEAVDWSAVLEQHSRWLRLVVYSRLQEPQAVEEVMQNVAVAVVEQKAPLSDPTRLSAWLYRIAVFQVLMYRRSAGRRRKLAQSFAEATPLSEQDSTIVEPLEWLLAVERQQLIQVGLKRLSDQDREILLLKYFEDWSYREISSHLGMSESAVEARLHRARGRLRQALRELNVIEAAS